MHYVVMDLEWNQCPQGKKKENPKLPFEIIEIGAVLLDENFREIGQFAESIRPLVYRRMHYRTREVLDIELKDLKKARSFSSVIRDFFSWVPEDAKFCTWGPSDLLELQRNMAYYRLKSPLPFPLLYYDVQKLFSLLYDDGKSRLSLAKAAEALGISSDRPFHHAVDDAYYTALILEKMDFERVKEYLSVDYFRIPRTPEEEFVLRFPNYTKWVSRGFASREEAMRDKNVTSLRCYECSRIMRKRLRWFTGSAHYYLGLAYCPKHGYVKGKLRIKKALDGSTFVVKTVKLVSPERAETVRQKQLDVREKRKAKRHRKIEENQEND